MSEAADKEINRWRLEVAIALARKVDAEMLADPPIGWRVDVSEGEPMTDEQLETHITFTPEDELTDEQRESIRAFFAEFGNRGYMVYKGIPVVPIEIVEKPS